MDGKVVYYNLQNGCETLADDDEYEWVKPPDLDDYISVTPEQLYLNRELIHKDLMAVLTK